MTQFSAFLATQPLLALFLTIALGYLLGAINVRGFSLGAGAVLFVGLAVGAIVPNLAVPALIGNLGLLLFLYGVGIAYGAQFFRGLTSRDGAKANLAAAVAVMASLGLTLAAVAWVPGVAMAEALGAFAGAGTSTAALQAGIAVFGHAPATGYSVAYPLGVAVPILLLGLYKAVARPALDKRPATVMHAVEVDVLEFNVLGMHLNEASRSLPPGVSIVAVRRGHHNLPATGHTALERDDVLLLTGTDAQVLRQAALRFGPLEPGRMLKDRSDLDYERFFISNPAIAGLRLQDLPLPPALGARVLHLRRSDVDLSPNPDRLLEFGDRIGVLAPRGSFRDLSRIFGDSVRGTAEVSYLAIGVGVTLGLLFGAIAWPLPVIGHFSLGFAGLLLVALLLGWRRRTGPFQWAMPVSANLVLRNFGLTVFLAVVGISSGVTFADSIAHSGLTYLLLGGAIVAVLVMVSLLVAICIFRIPFDMAVGIMAGATGNPAILAFANRQAPTDKPDIGYAMIFPSMTVLKILIVQLIGHLSIGG